MRILIMGLPGSGKTTLARELNRRLHSKWYNADDVRSAEDDWDFSAAGRIRQANRMRCLADDSQRHGFRYVICDFVAPTNEIRNIFQPDFIIWMNTTDTSIYSDTNSIFEPPESADLTITNFNYSIDDIIALLTL